MKRLPDYLYGDPASSAMADLISELQVQVMDLVVRTAALEAAGSGASGNQFVLTGKWQVNSTANANPKKGQVTCDTGVFSSATKLKFSDSDQNNTDFSSVMTMVTGIYAQQVNSAANWVRYDVDGVVTLQRGYLTVPISVVAYSGETNSSGWVDAVVALIVSVQ